MDLGMLLIVLAACGGAIVAALLGWLDSGQEFVPRKFFPSLIRAAFAGVLAVVSYPVVGAVTIPLLIGAALAGAGVDVIGNRLAGSIVPKK